MPPSLARSDLHALEAQMRALAQRGLSAEDLIGVVAEEARRFEDVRDVAVRSMPPAAAEDLDGESFL